MNDNFNRVTQGSLVYYQAKPFAEAGIKHLFTTRLGGVSCGEYASLNFRTAPGETRDNIKKNYEIALTAIGLNPKNLVYAKQIHSDTIFAPTEKDAGNGYFFNSVLQGDGFVTNNPNLVLAVFFADCLPILFFDPVKRVIAAVHSGWRGTSLSIAVKAVQKMNTLYGCKFFDIYAAFGPCACGSCFETDADVPQAMYDTYGTLAEPYIQKHGNKFYVDNAGINRAALIREGLQPENIYLSELCTMCGEHKDDFWSHRLTKGKRGVNAAFISL